MGDVAGKGKKIKNGEKKGAVSKETLASVIFSVFLPQLIKYSTNCKKTRDTPKGTRETSG